MDGRGECVTVARLAVLHQVSVLVLGADAEQPSLVSSLTEVIDGPSRVVVVDCLAISWLGHDVRDRLVMAHRAMAAAGRHLIVVNVPVNEVAPLREHGVDVAATSDVDFANSSSAGYAHGQSLI